MTTIKSPITSGQDMMNSIADALDAAAKMPSSRELAMVKTKLDEAIMWGNRALMGLHEVLNEAPAAAQAAPTTITRAALAIVSEAVLTYLNQLQGREPPPDQSPVDVIEAASRHVMAQRGIAVPSDLREVCTQVLQHYLRKEVR